MDVRKYIESGVLEDYCMGLLNEQDQAYLIEMTMLYPEVKTELTVVEQALENLAVLNAVDPHPAVKQRVIESLDFDNTGTLSLDDLPIIDHATNPQPWLNALGHLIPGEPSEDFTCLVIREDEIVRQMLVVSKIDVPEEDHDDFLESFFILKGRCECTIGEDFYVLGAGDFIEIPLYTRHDIKLVTPVVAAILQYRFV